MEPLRGTETESPRTEVWAALMARIKVLVDKADAEELRMLTCSYTDLTR